MATSAPARAMARAIALPRRRAPPVMSTDLPVKSPTATFYGNKGQPCRCAWSRIMVYSAHEHRAPGPALQPAGMPPVRDRERVVEQALAPGRLYLERSGRGFGRRPAPALQRRGAGGVHQRPQGVQVSDGREGVPEAAGGEGTKAKLRTRNAKLNPATTCRMSGQSAFFILNPAILFREANRSLR